MTATLDQFLATLESMGTTVMYHREAGGANCPCLSREGFRQPAFHNTKSPTLALGAAGGPTGACKYRVTFVKAEGECGSSKESATINPANQIVVLTNIPLGPKGTTQRKVYRSRDGGAYGLITTLNDNTTTAFNDAAVADPAAAIIPAVCNEQGQIAQVVTEFTVKAAVQPAIARSRTRAAERVDELLGEVERDDHIGIFPVNWQGNVLDFRDWSPAGEDYILYNGRRYLAVASDKVPDVDGDPDHHWEVGLRLVKTERPS